MRDVILIAWEFPGYNTQGGKALSKRIFSVADGLKRAGYSVSVVTRNHSGKKIERKNDNIFPVYLTPGPSNNPTLRIAWVRKIWVFFCVLFLGDQSGIWGIKTFFYLRKKFVTTNEVTVISFFTPRGPLLCGYLLKFFFGCKWIVDLQDNFDHGLSRPLAKLARLWMAIVLKNADCVIHVSPEWASRDGQMLQKKMVTLRHALPDFKQVTSKKYAVHKQVKLLYYGGLSNEQKQAFFFDYVATADVEFWYAGFQSVDNWLINQGMNDRYRYLGWLDFDELLDVLNIVDFVLIFGWKANSRQVAPSKMYELISMNVPMIVIGEDSGGIKSLESEFGFRFLWAKNINELKSILRTSDSYTCDYKAFHGLKEENFIKQYTKIINSLYKEVDAI